MDKRPDTDGLWWIPLAAIAILSLLGVAADLVCFH
jgi:hypothetical protein